MGWVREQEMEAERKRVLQCVCLCCSICVKAEPPCSISHSVGPDASALRDTLTHRHTHSSVLFQTCMQINKERTQTAAKLKVLHHFFVALLKAAVLHTTDQQQPTSARGERRADELISKHHSITGHNEKKLL